MEALLCIYLIIFAGVSIRDTGNRNTFIKIFRILGISTSRFIVKSYFRYAISAAKIMIIATACIILVISIWVSIAVDSDIIKGVILVLFFETFVVIFTVVYILLSKTVYDSAMNTKDNLRKNGKSWLYIFLLAEYVHLIVTLILSLPIYVIMLIIRLLL